MNSEQKLNAILDDTPAYAGRVVTTTTGIQLKVPLPDKKSVLLSINVMGAPANVSNDDLWAALRKAFTDGVLWVQPEGRQGVTATFPEVAMAVVSGLVEENSALSNPQP